MKRKPKQTSTKRSVNSTPYSVRQNANDPLKPNEGEVVKFIRKAINDGWTLRALFTEAFLTLREKWGEGQKHPELIVMSDELVKLSRQVSDLDRIRLDMVSLAGQLKRAAKMLSEADLSGLSHGTRHELEQFKNFAETIDTQGLGGEGYILDIDEED